jgi:ketosteroid isomerase-like protein
MKDVSIIARDCFEAYVRKDREAIEQLIDENFHFTSPLDNRIDRVTYFERCWPNSQHIKKFEFTHILTHGDQVFVTYKGTSNNGEGFRNTEILTIRQEKIVEVEVFFGQSIPHKALNAGDYVDPD